MRERVFSVGFGPGLDSCLLQGVGALPTMLRDARLASPKHWVAGPQERRDRWIQFAQSPQTVAHQPRAGCIRLVG